VARALAADATWQAIVVDVGRVVGVGAEIHPPGVVPPPETWSAEAASSNSYSPSARVKREVTARDQHCIVPGCTGSPLPEEYDHIEPYDPAKPPGEQTIAGGIQILCKTHHQLKTHHGWRFARDPLTGVTTITTTTGTTIEVPPHRILTV
jgi:hypothetical protein